MFDLGEAMMGLLATTSPSEELDSRLLDWVPSCFILAIAFVAVSGGLLILPHARDFRRTGCWMGAVGVVLGLAHLAFALYVYKIDYVAVAVDGTPASRPILQALMVPVLPVLCGLVFASCWLFRASRASLSPPGPRHGHRSLH